MAGVLNGAADRVRGGAPPLWGRPELANSGQTNFNRGSALLALFQSRHPSGQSLGALGQMSVSSCKSLEGSSGGADAGANDVVV